MPIVCVEPRSDSFFRDSGMVSTQMTPRRHVADADAVQHGRPHHHHVDAAGTSP
jgi:hypothetical protein